MELGPMASLDRTYSIKTCTLISAAAWVITSILLVWFTLTSNESAATLAVWSIVCAVLAAALTIRHAIGKQTESIRAAFEFGQETARYMEPSGPRRLN